MPINKDIRILIADDSRMLRTIHKDLLKKLGFSHLSEAENGLDALEKISAALKNAQPIDLVLLDTHMPKMSGLEMLQRMKTTPELKNLPVLMVTAESEQSFVLELMKTGINGYVIKPLTEESLMENLKKIYE